MAKMDVTKTIQTVELPEYQQDFQRKLLDSTEAYMNAPIEVLEERDYIAERPELLTQADELAQAGIGAYQPYLDQADEYTALAADYAKQQADMAKQAGGRFDPSGISQFMNPYEALVLDPALERIREQQLMSEQQLRAQAAQQGAFGGSRAALQQQMAARDYERDRMEMIGKMKYDGFTTASDMAMKAFQDEKDRQLGIASLLGQTGTQMGQAGVMSADMAERAQTLGLQDVSTLRQLGMDQMNYDQSLLDADRTTALARLNAPVQKLAFGADVFAGQPTTPTTMTTQMTPSTGADKSSQFLGTGIALIGAGRTYGNPFSYAGGGG
tara:strand:- start:700 stop:1677 length:978 start_codon:yes stop_codon:yes gene_type:complete